MGTQFAATTDYNDDNDNTVINYKFCKERFDFFFSYVKYYKYYNSTTYTIYLYTLINNN